MGGELSRRSPIASSRRRAPRRRWPHGVVRLEGQIAALTADPAFNGGDYTAPPRKGIEAFGDGVGRLALLAGVVAAGAVEDRRRPASTLEQEIENRRRTFFARATTPTT